MACLCDFGLRARRWAASGMEFHRLRWRRRLELALKDGWGVNGEAVRAGLVNNVQIAGARLVTGSHIRIR